MDISSGGSRTTAQRPVDGLQATRSDAALRGRLGSLPQFFATTSVPCPYVPERAERKLIVELTGRGAAGFYDDLSRAGFRRSHRFAYRPACRQCTACVPVRIAVERFAHSRSTRRVRNLNRALTARLLAPRATLEQFRLFTAYQCSRHRDSDMAAMSYAEYRSMVEDSAARTALVEFRDPDGALAAMALVDRPDAGLPAGYTFYDPARDTQSLGTGCRL